MTFDVEQLDTHGGSLRVYACHLAAHHAQAASVAALRRMEAEAELDRIERYHGFSRRVAAVLEGRRTQIKGLLRDQTVFAGIGNAYSDEILHAAKMSPYLLAAKLAPEQVEHLYRAMRDTLAEATAEASGKPPAELKDAKRRAMRVHGRTGQACPVCGDTVRQVIFADSTFQYCPTCQTGGKPLADRVLSRLVK